MALDHAGKKQAWLARECGVTPQAVSGWIKTGNVDKAHLPTIADRTGLPIDWFLRKNVERLPAAVMRRGRNDLNIPYMNVLASAGGGTYPPDSEIAVDHMRISENWLRRNLTMSAPQNIRILQAFDDSMRPTFDDGDILFVDTGVTEIKLDAVYVLCIDDKLFVKRVLLRSAEEMAVKSDNPLYDPMVVNRARNDFAVLGRVIWVWNGNKL